MAWPGYDPLWGNLIHWLAGQRLRRQVLADRERVLPGPAPRTDSSRNNLANACRAAGRLPS